MFSFYEHISTSKYEHIYSINSTHTIKYEFIMISFVFAHVVGKENAENGILISLIHFHVFGA